MDGVVNKCQVCTEAVSKYKCPKCRVKYCSVVCYKTHRQDECHASSTESDIIFEIDTQGSTSDKQILFPTDDTVMPKTLENLHVHRPAVDPWWGTTGPDGPRDDPRVVPHTEASRVTPSVTPQVRPQSALMEDPPLRLSSVDPNITGVPKIGPQMTMSHYHQDPSGPQVVLSMTPLVAEEQRPQSGPLPSVHQQRTLVDPMLPVIITRQPPVDPKLTTVDSGCLSLLRRPQWTPCCRFPTLGDPSGPPGCPVDDPTG
ncbi:uncharacterized protein [Procambarus clarkii]|uniref:uncharacterized protein isoform X2 n=1 Tax=Procambarus clarkii TaxID=6728 RepID=UPI003742F543